MPSQTNDMDDVISILVATDNHVGYAERDPVRGDDSWKTFHEIMCMAKERDVDMVLLGGDLFHDNVPSRKSMYNVMRSLRLNCYGDKPCELEILNDGSEHFDATIGHANYEDMNINVAIPVFSIHGNHDDPSGEGHFASLDILEMSGLMNYFGRIPISDEIHVKPLLLQKGTTKLAIFGMSNVRDERMHRSFRDKQVHFYQPGVQKSDWYNIGVVHQNHHAHTATSYLPESWLPTFLDLVVWGHEHECDIEPHLNPDMNFRVMQPGSSVATSLVPGEAAQKHVALITITGREMKSEPIKLKTVRPFVYRDINLGMEKEAKKIGKGHNHRHVLTQWLMARVEELIAEANQQWQEAQGEDETDEEPPLPLIRLRVDHTTTDGIRFEVENPQRFSNRFAGRVANKDDVIQFHVKKRNATAQRVKASEELKELMAKPELPETVKVSKLVAEFLAAQSLTILPQNYFGDAVNQYIDKDDKHAMDLFINDSLTKQIRHLVSMNEDDGEGEDILERFGTYKSQLEDMFTNGELKSKRTGKLKYKPKPDDWDSEEDGDWEDQPAALVKDDNATDEDSDDSDEGTPQPATRGRGRGRGRGVTASTRGAASTRGRGGVKKAAPTKATPARGKSRKKVAEESEEEEEEEEDVIMLDDDDDDDDEEDAGSDSQAMFFADKKKATNGSARASRAGSIASSTTKTTKTTSKPAATTRKTPVRAATTKPAKQSTLQFSTSQASVFGDGAKSQRDVRDIEDDDDDDDDDDAFEPVSTAKSTRSRR